MATPRYKVLSQSFESPNYPTNVARYPVSTPSTAARLRFEGIQQPYLIAQAPKSGFTVAKKAISKPHVWDDTWVFELLCLITSALALVGTVIVLKYYNGHPIPIVLPYDVKLGSVLAVLSTVMRAAIGVFLAAGLGQMIWSQFRQGSRPLSDVSLFDDASRGVTGGITLLWSRHGNWRSTIGIFCTLLVFAIGPTIQGTLGSEYTTGLSTLPRCTGNHSAAGNGFTVENMGTLFNQYQASIFLSTFDPSGPSDETLQSLNTNCATGNCKWPVFASLAICSNTTDMYDQTIKNYDSDGSVASLTLPNGLSVPKIGGNPTYWNGSITFPTINYNDWRYDPIARFSVLFHHNDLHGSGMPDYRSAEGIMYWCVQSYEASVTSNILSSKIKSNWWPDYMNNSAETQVLSPPDEFWKDSGITEPTDFTVHRSMTRWLPFFNLSVDINNTKYNPPNQLQIIAGFSVASLPDFFTYLASAMTNRFRGTICNESVDGTMHELQVLKVQWYWLILPCASIVFTFGFLLAVIADSWSQGAMIWKNSILPILFHGLSEDIRKNKGTGNVASARTMKNQAKSIHVQLKENDADYAGLLLRSS
ncbi:hypothetical protein BP5796_12737 [Coleophoma crateriformis]|uniref:Uncharacterized protein n=1 Tax=Coleophoma crateriformis TaxID=565419 RepID=A0A3D8Q6I3_9HELO|nr:hypothetical protein BP5796_12737 [Coleophoma crateriformis]